MGHRRDLKVSKISDGEKANDGPCRGVFSSYSLSETAKLWDEKKSSHDFTCLWGVGNSVVNSCVRLSPADFRVIDPRLCALIL